MKKIKNELGEEVIAIGNSTSPARMLQKYPKTINSILDFIKNGNYYSYELITDLVKESGIDKSDYKNVLNAITFYSNELIILQDIMRKINKILIEMKSEIKKLKS